MPFRVTPVELIRSLATSCVIPSDGAGKRGEGVRGQKAQIIIAVLRIIVLLKGIFILRFLSLNHACPTLHVVRPTSAKYGLHASNVKFNTHNKECIRVCAIPIYCS
jgi:hypothetical protein